MKSPILAKVDHEETAGPNTSTKLSAEAEK
jgi:hypothetical protein